MLYQNRASSYVILDLRGNGDGNSAYGRLVAKDLYGDDYVASIFGPKDDFQCPSVYRASEKNIEASRNGARQFEKEGDSRGARAYAQALDLMQATASSQQRFATSWMPVFIP